MPRATIKRWQKGTRASACKTLASQTRNAACSRFSTVQFANSPKRSAGQSAGGRKNYILNSRRSSRRCHKGGCAGESVNPAKQVSLGSPRVGTIHVQAPTPHAPPLQAFLADFALSRPLKHESTWPWFASRAPRSTRLLQRWRMRRKRLPTTRPIPEGVQEPICPRKSVQFGPDGA